MPGDQAEAEVPYHAGPLRHLTAEEREARQAYLAAHPDVNELDLPPTTAGYAPVADWLASLEPPAAPEEAVEPPAAPETGELGTGQSGE